MLRRRKNSPAPHRNLHYSRCNEVGDFFTHLFARYFSRNHDSWQYFWKFVKFRRLSRKRGRSRKWEPLTVVTLKKSSKNRQANEKREKEREMGHDLKANTLRLSSQRIRARPRHKTHKARRISLALRCGGCPATNRSSLLARAIIRSFYLWPNLPTLRRRPSFSTHFIK